MLVPVRVDEYTGYRYYSEEQLLTAKRILAFKEHGFTLEQIRMFLQTSSTDETVDQLRAKQLELRKIIQDAQKKLDDIHDRINRLQHITNRYEINKIHIRDVEPQLIASIRDLVPRTQLCLLIDEILRYGRDHQPAGSADDTIIIIWHSDSQQDIDDGLIDVEVAIPLTSSIPDSERIQVRDLPGMLAASLMHECDPYRSSCSVAHQLTAWIHEQDGIVIAPGAYREVYLSSDRDLYGSLRLSELLIPIASSI